VPAPSALARFGDEFAQRGEHAVLVVPSALAASENNWLLNSGHPEFKKILVHTPQPLCYDSRMFTKRQGRGEEPH
jgi:RES domain-containing protein